MTINRRRLGQGDFDLFAAAHERFVSGKPGGRKLSLKFVDLTGVSMAHRILDDADFSGSVLQNCNMAGARLERAVLFGCDLRGADLTRARLVRADIRGTCLQGADLSEANLTQADFREGVIAVPHETKGLAAARHETRGGQADG
ncbi:MAG: pentapeptide repeat-containing protein, partial [Brevundimonas sp.]